MQIYRQEITEVSRKVKGFVDMRFCVLRSGYGVLSHTVDFIL